jgi:creatinine amidohydrolase
MTFWPNLAWTAFRERAGDDRAIALLPVASIEQHGPHLPVFTDTLIGEAIAGRAEGACADDGVPVLRLPALCYGHSNEHTEFPGTVTLSSQTLLAVLDDVGASVARAGVGRLVLLNTHGGNTALLQVAARDIRQRHGLMVACVNPMSAIDARRGDGGIPEMEARFGIHAGLVETSVMLALHPELVDMAAAAGRPPDVLASTSHLGFAGPNTVAWLASDLAADGVLGDPRGATAEAGQAHLTQAVDAARTALAEFSTLRFRPA